MAIENIHTRLARGEPVKSAVLEATQETITPRLLAMLSVLAVFVPSFFMIGVARSLFIPLSLAVGFAMLASYFLSNTLVPVLSVWFSRGAHKPGGRPSFFEKARDKYQSAMRSVWRLRWVALGCYLVIVCAGIFLIGRNLGTDIFPNVDTGQFRLRMRAPTGTRVERTEVIALKALDAIKAEAGSDNVAITLGFVGAQPPSYPINTIHLWTSGPQEAVLLVALRERFGDSIE